MDRRCNCSGDRLLPKAYVKWRGPVRDAMMFVVARYWRLDASMGFSISGHPALAQPSRGVPFTLDVERLDHAPVSSQAVSAAGGMKLMARSASAVMVRLGLTPRFAATTDPSQMYMFL
jgi:hypothetical protein